MKLVRSSGEQLIFRLGKREKAMLLELLGFYPQVPTDHHVASMGGTGNAETQTLLNESLKESREENRERLRRFISDTERFRTDEKGLLLRLTAAEMEWLLQVLNDIRVGSWVKLGAPDQLSGIPPTEATMPDVWAMELAGYFQAGLLHAFDESGREES